MQITRLTLTNIKTYVSQTIEFPDGSLLLAGDIGSGKSTILQAIEFALFGAKADSGANALLRSDATRGNIELDLIINQTTYKICRELVRAKTGSVTSGKVTLTQNSILSELTPTELRTKLLSILAYPQIAKSDLFRYTVYTSQEQMKEILLEGPQVRLATIRALFGIDSYKTITENANLLVKSIKDDATFLAGFLSANTNTQQKLDEITLKINQMSIQETQLKTIAESAKQEMQVAAINHQTLLEKKQQLDMLLEKHSLLQVQSTNLTQQIEQYTHQIKQKNIDITNIRQKIAIPLAEVTQEQISDAANAIEQLNKQQVTYQNAQIQLATLNSQLQQIQQYKTQITQCSQRLITLEIKPHITKQIKEIEQKLTDLQEQKEALLTQIASITQPQEINLESECPVCYRPLTDHDIAHVQNHMQQLKTQSVQKKNTLLEAQQLIISQILRYQTDVQLLRSELTKQATILATKKSIDEQIIELSNKIKQEIEISQKISQLQAVRAVDTKPAQLVLDDLQKQRSDYILQQTLQQSLTLLLDSKNQLRELIDASTTKFEELQTTLTQIKSIILNLDQIKVQFTQSQQLLEQKQVQHTTQLQELAHIRATIQTLQLSKDQISETYQRVKDAERKYALLATKKDWISRWFVPLIAELEQNSFRTIYATFTELFTKWFNVLLEDKLLQVSVSEDFSPIITQNGYQIPLEYLSGGEKQTVALAYRLALNQALNDLYDSVQTKDLLILDEPTDGFSTEQLDRIKIVLEQLKLKQLIIVSHEPKIETFVQHIIRLRKENHITQVQYL